MARTKAGYVIDSFTGETNNGYGNMTHMKLTPQQAIRHFCWSCMGGHEFPWKNSDGTIEKPYRPYDEIKDCESTTCYLHPFRTGRNPYNKRAGNADALQKHRDSQAGA